MKQVYGESDNAIITTARSITDRIGGFFSENETAMVIKKFREIDPNFQMEPFLTNTSCPRSWTPTSRATRRC
jgi:import inner membrane translocase subunit TIM44